MSSTDAVEARRRIGREVMTFFVLTFALSWLAGVPLVLLPIPDPVGGVLLVTGVFSPSAAALILAVQRVGWRATRDEFAAWARWRLPWRMWIRALLGPAAVILTAIALSTLAGHPVVEWPDPTRAYPLTC